MVTIYSQRKSVLYKIFACGNVDNSIKSRQNATKKAKNKQSSQNGHEKRCGNVDNFVYNFPYLSSILFIKLVSN